MPRRGRRHDTVALVGHSPDGELLIERDSRTFYEVLDDKGNVIGTVEQEDLIEDQEKRLVDQEKRLVDQEERLVAIRSLVEARPDDSAERAKMKAEVRAEFEASQKGGATPRHDMLVRVAVGALLYREIAGTIPPNLGRGWKTDAAEKLAKHWRERLNEPPSARTLEDYVTAFQEAMQLLGIK
jgi:hypothetical protein